MAPVIETLPVPALELGEGPHWSSRTSSLYLVDLMGGKVYRYHPDTDSVYCLKLDSRTVGFVTPVADSAEELIVGADLSLLQVKWDGRSEQALSQRIVQSLDDEPVGNRINDGKADPTGRLWFGTMLIEDIFSARKGSFYSFSKDSGLQKHASNIGISNGMDWSDAKDTMYYNDSTDQTVDVFNYSSSGKIDGRRVVLDLRKNNLPFYPDGMTLDADGKLWVALYGGSRVIQIDPEAGKIVSEVKLPTTNITSVAWGGPDLSDLYVTSAKIENDPNSGKTFRVRGLGARGRPMYEAVI